MATALLAALTHANGLITLGLEVAGAVIPIAKGTIAGIKQIATGSSTVSYQILVNTDEAALAAVEQMSQNDLTAINAELAKLGLPPVPASAPAPAAAAQVKRSFTTVNGKPV